MVNFMAKAIVIYFTKFGNTKLVAETIAEGLKEIEGTETVVKDVKDVDVNSLGDYDVFLIGSPNHIGGPVGSIKKLIDKIGKLSLTGKKITFFDTTWENDLNKTVGKMEKRVDKKIPDIEKLTPGLSILVNGMKGPLVEGELPKCKEFGEKIGTQIKT